MFNSARLGKIVFVFIGAHALSLFWAAISHRPMFADGVGWYFEIIGGREYFYNDIFWRTFTRILQIPSVLFMKYFPIEPVNPTASILLGLTYSLHPIVSLIFTYWLLKKLQKTEFFIFPVLSFALFTQALMAYPSMIIPEALSLFWPLFFIFLFGTGKNYAESHIALLLTLFLAVSYEQSFLLLVVCIGVLLLRRWQKKPFPNDFVFLTTSLMATVFLIWRIVFIYENYSQEKITSSINLMFSGFMDNFTILSFYLIAMLAITFIFFYFLPKMQRVLLLLFPILFLTAAWFLWPALHMNTWPSIVGGIWGIRLIIIPFTCVLAFICMLVGIFDDSSVWAKSRRVFPLLLILLNFALFSSLVRDLITTTSWRKSYQTAKLLHEKNPGCNIMARKDFATHIAAGSMLNDWSFPWISLGFERDAKLTSIFFLEDVPNGKSCLLHDNKKFIFGEYNFEIDLNRVKHLDFSAILKGPIQIHEWDSIKGGFSQRIISR